MPAFGHPAHEDAAGSQRRGHIVERLENLGLGEVLEQVGGGDRRVVRRMRGEDGAEVSLADSGHACRVGECHLLRADIYAFRLPQPDELTAPAAKVNDGSGPRRRQQGTDATLETIPVASLLP